MLPPESDHHRPSVALVFTHLATHPGLVMTAQDLLQTAIGHKIYAHQVHPWLHVNSRLIRDKAAEIGLNFYLIGSPDADDPTYVMMNGSLPMGAKMLDRGVTRYVSHISPALYHRPLLGLNTIEVNGPNSATFLYPENSRHLVNHLALAIGRVVPATALYPGRGLKADYLDIRLQTNARLRRQNNPLRIYLIDHTSSFMLLTNGTDVPLDLPYPFPHLDRLPTDIREKISQAVRLKSCGTTKLRCDLTTTHLKILSAWIAHPDKRFTPNDFGLSADSYVAQVKAMRHRIGPDLFLPAPRGYRSHSLAPSGHTDRRLLSPEAQKYIRLQPQDVFGRISQEIITILGQNPGQPVPRTKIIDHLSQICGKKLKPETLKTHIVYLRRCLRDGYTIRFDNASNGYVLSTL